MFLHRRLPLASAPCRRDIPTGSRQPQGSKAPVTTEGEEGGRAEEIRADFPMASHTRPLFTPWVSTAGSHPRGVIQQRCAGVGDRNWLPQTWQNKRSPCQREPPFQELTETGLCQPPPHCERQRGKWAAYTSVEPRRPPPLARPQERATSLLWDALKQLHFAFFPSPSEKPHSVTTRLLGSERLTATYLQVQGQPENADKALIDLQSPHKTSYLHLWFLLGCSSAAAQPV